MTFGYVPAISFLGLILILLLGLLAMYYCLTHDLCPCAQTEQKAGYEELQLGEDNEGTDEDTYKSSLSPKSVPEIVTPSDGTDAERYTRPAVSAYGDVTGEQRGKDLTDVGSIRSTGTAKGSLANAVYMGKVFLMAEFFPDVGRVGFSIVEARSIPSKSKGGGTYAKFHVTLLPDKKQRFKTKALKTPDPQYKETFVFDRLMKEDLFRVAVRMRVYGQTGVSKEKYIGELSLQLADLVMAPNMRIETWRDILRPSTPGTATP
ncbi:synaptotagmin-3-like isoform X2 [Actinia tenebrosa]|uniref:Synaptotagmin-3-like isoform X2 n=1 Tax=Actinia tenebrosa TaxID=6105 RepID=A0A6P8IG36_ACTTE|nr:synaptotagmin-3-like isoform X2 [Actinia tenebrosa]